MLATTAHAQGHAQASDWSWKGGWDVDLGDLKPTHEGEYVYNPKAGSQTDAVNSRSDWSKDSSNHHQFKNLISAKKDFNQLLKHASLLFSMHSKILKMNPF